MAGKADLVNSIVDSVEGITFPGFIGGDDDAAYESLDAAEAAGGDRGRGDGWREAQPPTHESPRQGIGAGSAFIR